MTCINKDNMKSLEVCAPETFVGGRKVTNKCGALGRGDILKIIVELVRGLFLLSVTALFGSLLFTAFWIFQQRVNWNPNSTNSNTVAQAYEILGTEAWLRTHVWLLLDVGLVGVSILLAQLWRYSVRVMNRSKPD